MNKDLERKFALLDAEVRLVVDALKAAREYIDASPCDPDITLEQFAAWKRYQDAMQALGDDANG